MPSLGLVKLLVCSGGETCSPQGIPRSRIVPRTPGSPGISLDLCPVELFAREAG